MFRASVLSITASVQFFQPLLALRNVKQRYLHSGYVSRQEQRKSLGGSRLPPDFSEHSAGTSRQLAQDGTEDLGSMSTSGSNALGSTATATATATAHDREPLSTPPASGQGINDDERTSSQRVSPPNIDIDAIKQRLQEWSEQTAIVIRNRADDFTARSKTTFSQLGAHLNKVTGYEEIEALKRQVVEQEKLISAARQAARDAKLVYQQAVIQRSNSQREVNELLQRKSIWTDDDVGRFTTLVRQDHLYEQEEQRAKAAVDETEDGVEREFSQLMRTILARYHEEQVWSDKIRSASTYGSLTVLGLNLVVFILAIVVVEPWKRRNLAKTFENKIQELSVENAVKLDATMQEIGGQLAQQEQILAVVKDELKVRLDAMAEAQEKLSEGERKADSAPVPPAAAEALHPSKTRELELVAAGIGAGAFIATALSWFWLGR